eukprot:CAMPEP_0171514598 /NCGR_PEP_ID=MMETSP0959-20130129/2943_1 /TAXON_ID=87120 /ORGANISM="Aurantiochytrium limacinum, Strain ATCCMYA-1381" /LENGTH=68 /DNA_ID=CAMNT_0012052961 /DNA_START=297 /DNA_END=503 /DNA_ORIENTATION=+
MAFPKLLKKAVFSRYQLARQITCTKLLSAQMIASYLAQSPEALRNTYSVILPLVGVFYASQFCVVRAA